MGWIMVNKCKFFNTYLICIQSTLVDKEENKTDSIMFNYFQLLLFISFLFFPFFFLVFLGLHLQHMEVPSLGIESGLQLPAYGTAPAMTDPICICDLHHSSWQHRTL